MSVASVERQAKDESRAGLERAYETHEDHLPRDIVLESPRATKDMCAYCFDVLLAHFQGQEEQPPSFDVRITCPLFVTWEKASSRDEAHSLRGCIGTLSARPLSCLKEYTFSSALRDRRFSPISLKEVPRLRCSVSLLVNYEPARHAEDWQVGVHGIIIAFSDPGAGDDNSPQYSATYLPEVAEEQGWTRGEALRSLVRKAGYQGAVTRQLLAAMTVTRYQSSKAKLTYEEYLEMADAAAADGHGTAATAAAGAAAAATATASSNGGGGGSSKTGRLGSRWF